MHLQERSIQLSQNPNQPAHKKLHHVFDVRFLIRTLLGWTTEIAQVDIQEAK